MTADPTQRVLAIAEDPAILTRVTQAIEAAGATAIPVQGLAQLERTQGQLPFRFAVYAWDGAPAAVATIVKRLREGAQLTCVIPPSHLSRFTELLADPRINHVLTADDHGFGMLRVTVQKYVTGDLFGIEKYVPSGTQVFLTRLRDYRGRTAAIDEVLAYAEKVGVRRQIRSSIGSVCEELLMNALYDAPVDEKGNAIFAEVDIKARLDQLSPRPVSIRYAATEAGFAVAVRDRFGRLDKGHVLRYIDKCLKSPVQIDRKVYGAGLGIYLIANAATHFVISVAPGMATEVVCTFDRKTAKTSLRTISVFVYPSGQQQPQRAAG